MTPWNVLITAYAAVAVGQPALEELRSAGCNVIVPPRFGPYSEPELAPLLVDVDAVLASYDQYDAALFATAAAKKVKILSRWGVGYDSIDVPAATRAGVVVANAPVLSETVADYTMALIFALARRIVDGHQAVATNQWAQFWASDIHGKTLGLIGCGRIGQAVARRSAGFGMRLLAVDPYPHPAARSLGIEFVTLDQLLRESDFISLHAAADANNRHLIGAAQLKQMKPGALLVNAARGALIDEAALRQALIEGQIAGAALDVFESEPLPAESPLRSAPNLLLSPHQASCTQENGLRVSMTAARAIVDLCQGRRPQFAVNPEVFDSPQLRCRL